MQQVTTKASVLMQLGQVRRSQFQPGMLQELQTSSAARLLAQSSGSLGTQAKGEQVFPGPAASWLRSVGRRIFIKHK